MSKKENKVENWNSAYQGLRTTYSEELNTPANLVNRLQYEFVAEDIERFLPSREGCRVLEVGCGGARTSLYLALRGYDATCSDNAPEALRLAQSNFEAAGARGTFVRDDLLNSTLPADSFDCVMSFGLLEHFENLHPVLAATTRLTRPGGLQIHCIIPKKLSTQTLMNAIYFPGRLARNVIRGRFEQLVAKSFRDFPHYENSYSAKEYSEAFEREGNTVLRCEAGGALVPFLFLPFGIGNRLVSSFPDGLAKLVRRMDRTESELMHRLAVTFYIVSRKQVVPGNG
jgi:2-polyprenyl-3-methyl-5-hydroxy-6-metoxy-1,4-benzoquinol methylase